jgi:hypothetical protein
MGRTRNQDIASAVGFSILSVAPFFAAEAAAVGWCSPPPLPNNEAASIHAPVPFLLRLVPATALVVIYEHPASPRNRNLLANLKGPIDFKRFSARSISQLARRSRSREFLHIGRIFPRAYCRSSSASISASAASPIRQDRGHRLGAP